MKAVIIEDVDGKIYSLKKLMFTQTGKLFEFTDKMVTGVTVIRVDVDEFTAKKRPMPKRD